MFTHRNKILIVYVLKFCAAKVLLFFEMCKYLVLLKKNVEKLVYMIFFLTLQPIFKALEYIGASERRHIA